MNEIDKLQDLINNSNNIVFFGGAGVSTESGIKDFRGKNGIYKENNNLNRSPEYMLSNRCLMEEPEIFFEYYKNNFNFSNIKPNITHEYLKKLEDNNKLKAIVTQNIDGLHQKAGSKKVLEIHGTTNECYCMNCGSNYSGDYIFKSQGLPRCKCGGLIRPKVVLYGEMLPEEYNVAAYYIANADLLIVAGTSLTVEPASSLLRVFKGRNLVIINEAETPYDEVAELVIHQELGKVFSKLK